MTPTQAPYKLTTVDNAYVDILKRRVDKLKQQKSQTEANVAKIKNIGACVRYIIS